MRGHILQAEPAGGVIAGADGNRYSYQRTDWKAPEEPVAGLDVDFIASEGRAAEIFPLPGRVGLGLGAAAAAAPPKPQAAVQTEGSSVMLGVIGILCLVLSFLIPLLPLIASFVLGLVGSNSAKRHNNGTGLLLSRISWIGSLVLLAAGIGMLVAATMFAWPFLDAILNYIQNEIAAEAGRAALI